MYVGIDSEQVCTGSLRVAASSGFTRTQAMIDTDATLATTTSHPDSPWMSDVAHRPPATRRLKHRTAPEGATREPH